MRTDDQAPGRRLDLARSAQVAELLNIGREEAVGLIKLGVDAARPARPTR